MYGDLVDLNNPRHDPSLPRPRGLLPVPREVEEAVASSEARITREHGFIIAPEARKRMRDNWTLEYYYDGEYVASRPTPEGVEVLAVGWDEVGRYVQEHAPETRRDVRIGTV